MINPDSDLTAQLARQRETIEQLESQRRRLAELLLTMPKLFATRDPDELISGCAETARSLTDAAFGLFVPADPDQARILVGLAWTDFAEAPDPGLAPLLAVHDGKPARTIGDVTRWASSDAGSLLYGVLMDGRLVRSWLVAPVRGGEDDLRGALYLGHPRPRVFTSSDEQQVALLASSLGIALDAALLAAERERVLSALESSLLPPLLPDIPGLDLAARYRAADEAIRVGGDFYDVFRTGESRWSMALGDVCGAGPDAAAVTGIARYSIRALAPDLSPAAALERLNASLGFQDTEARFLTAILAEATVTPEGDVALTMANAGHPPPVLMRDDGSSSLLEKGHGVLLGVFPNVGAVDVSVALEPGDALILYTDGVVEARDKSDEQFGFDRLLELTATCAGRTAAGIARRLELAAVGHAAGMTDDIAVLVIRRRPG